MEPSPPRLLSIQSHVVHGYVGNRSVVFPLQLLGFEVDFINSVQFSNHTGYPNRWTGQVLNGEQLVDLVNGLERNSLLNYQYLLTGYVGSPTFLHNLLQAHSTLLKYSPNLIWACDPVMGDNGKLYVAPELVPLYRDEVVPRATILTPNQFECQLLTGMEINSNEDAAAACDKLHSLGPRAVIITSMEVPGSPGSLQLYASVSRTPIPSFIPPPLPPSLPSPPSPRPGPRPIHELETSRSESKEEFEYISS
eukprot:tig00000254_g22492.t1